MTPNQLNDLLRPIADKAGYTFFGGHYNKSYTGIVVILGDGTFNGKEMNLMDFIKKYAPEHEEVIRASFSKEVLLTEQERRKRWDLNNAKR